MFRWQSSKTRVVRTVCAGLAVLAAAACATQQSAHKGESASRHRNWDAAVYHYLDALARDPDNIEYRMALVRARQKAAQEHFRRGSTLYQLGQVAAARDELRLAYQLDPTHQLAEQQLRRVEEELAILARPDGMHELEEMKRRAREAKVKPPILDPRSKEPITLSFPKPKPVKEIYQAMAKAYGFNVLFDPKLKDDKLSIELRDVTAKDALEIVMRASGHFYKVHDEHTIIIAEDTPQMRREYEDLVIKTFFLSNAEVKDVDKLLRSLIEARRLATNEQLNSITLRDTADKVAIAERLIRTSDKAKAEVLIDVELLQINTSKDSEIGSSLSSYSYGLGLDQTRVTSNGGETVYLPDVNEIFHRNAWVFSPIPSLLINLVKSSGEAETLAQPQLRITEGEKASLVIGDSVPIPVTSFNTSNTVGGSVVPITSFQYRDVGIKIDVEPRVHHNREVTLTLTIEVSQLGAEVSVGSEQTATSIGTRNISSVIRLKDGETSLLAGLLRVDRTDSRSEMPGLSKIPLIGRLFTNKTRSTKKTDLVLTLTPHIIRFPDIAEEDLAPVWVGTESRISYFGSSSPRVESGSQPEGPFDRRQRPGSGEGGAEPAGEGAAQGAAQGEQQRRTSPFGVRRPSGPRSGGRGGPAGGVTPPSGTELGARSGGKSLAAENGSPSAADSGETSPARELAAVVEAIAPQPDLDPSVPPVIVSLEPSVVSLRPGDEVALQLVISGGGAVRLPLGLSFDPARLEVVDVQPAPPASLLSAEIDAGSGWLTLDLVVAGGSELPQVVATVRVLALQQGPAPLVFSTAGALAADGSAVPVAVNDGAVFVLADDREVKGR